MLLKSEGFASNLYAPDTEFSLRAFSAERGLPYLDIGLPVPIETFIDYGMEFQRRHVPELEETNVTSLTRTGDVFRLCTALGESVRSRNVIVAAGISHFARLPAVLENCSNEYVSHSSEHVDLSRFAGQRVAVIGAGASALDTAALLHEAGAAVQLVARRDTIAFHLPPHEPRSWKQRILKPRSGLGLSWRSWLCAEVPLVFHAMPQRLRLRAVERHLGPAPGWFVRDKVVGRFPMHLGVLLDHAQVGDRQVRLAIRGAEAGDLQLTVDHVIAATGYKTALARLAFLDGCLRSEVRSVHDTPILNRHFESSVPGLYFVGVVSANSFGPLARFACGAEFTAARIAKRLADA